jgi:hypothetical protein
VGMFLFDLAKVALSAEKRSTEMEGLSETASSHLLFQIPIDGREDPEVDPTNTVFPVKTILPSPHSTTTTLRAVRPSRPPLQWHRNSRTTKGHIR